MFAVLHQMLHTHICNPGVKFISNEKSLHLKIGFENFMSIYSLVNIKIPDIPIDSEDLQYRTGTGYSFNSLIRDLLAAIQIQRLQVLKRV
jgi:hypothetical protein